MQSKKVRVIGAYLIRILKSVAMPAVTLCPPCIFAVFCLYTVSVASAQDIVRMTVEPKIINIGTLYNGTALSATGSIPSNALAIVRFMGATCDLHMKERGKVCGIMWMNLDSITFKGAPSVCIISSAIDFDSLEASGSAAIKLLRLSGLKESIRIETDGGVRDNAFEELLKLKKKEGLYREMLGNISYEGESGGLKSFRAHIPVPSRLRPGAYVVELIAIRSGEIIGRTEQPVAANLVGFPALLAGLAFGHSALYGILATVVAVLAGLAIGLVFQSKGSH